MIITAAAANLAILLFMMILPLWGVARVDGDSGDPVNADAASP